jgi:Protein of unknown function (DUF2889)
MMSSPSGPATTTVARSPRSIRRTSHVDVVFTEMSTTPGDDLGGTPLRLRGRARDLYTDAAGVGTVLDEAEVEAPLKADRRLRSLRTTPSMPDAEELEGLVVGPGFRSALARVAGQSNAARSPLYLLLDDLPVVALISGYAMLYRSGRSGSGQPGDRLGGTSGENQSRLLKGDVCAGWRSDGTMMVALRSGEGMPVSVGPPAPAILDPADPLGWHHIDEMEVPSMRRRRLIDVTWGNPLVVQAMFRDSHRAEDGLETVLHEYSVDASVDPGTMQVLDCQATPRSLPWIECPQAAGSAGRLAGQPVRGLRSFVRDNLTGTTTCTHLNDLLRSLTDVAALSQTLKSRRGSGNQPEGPRQKGEAS